MELLVALVSCFLFALAFKRQIKRYPFVFYAVAVAIDVLFLSRILFGFWREMAIVSYPFAARCLWGFSLFALVMYLGVLPKASKLRQSLMPIRGELSIIASILTIGHVVNYLGTYLNQIISGFAGMSTGMVASFFISALLLVLLAVLTVTSFNAVRARLSKQVWKTIQKAAYLFFGFTYLHILLVLVPTISSSGQRSFISICVYSAVVFVYLFLRILKFVEDRRAIMQEGQTAGFAGAKSSQRNGPIS